MDPEILGQCAAIGIVKGKPFNPDARMKKILTKQLLLPMQQVVLYCLIPVLRKDLVIMVVTRNGLTHYLPVVMNL